MEFSDSLEQAEEYSAAAMSLLEKYGIPKTPANFIVWYCYVSEKFPDLKRTIDVLISNEREFNARVNDELHTKYFSFQKESDRLNTAAKKFEDMMAQIAGQMGESSEGAERYGEALQNFTGGLQAGSPDVKDLVSEILEETKAMKETNSKLETELTQSSEEIKQLKADLINMRKEAMTDALTGIANRKLFDSALREEVAAAMEKGHDLCLLMTDIDFFKKFNDTHGHQMGDQVLKLVARTLTECVKGQDTPARYGGEEFGIILPKTSLTQAIHVGNELRERLASKKMVNRKSGQDLGTITLSVGAAKYHFGEPINQWVHRADEALYLAKHSGRNQVKSEADLDDSAIDLQESA